MKIMVVDDELLALHSLIQTIGDVEPEADVVSFTEPENAFEYLSRNQVDIAFLDIQMGGLTGLELAEKCKALSAAINIIFVTAYSEYSMDALRLHASGYLMKPVRSEALRIELENLRHPISEKKPCRVRIHTFGNFEIFVDDMPLPLTYAKAKECLAYLVDRKGASVRYRELANVIWEDSPYDYAVQNYLYQAIYVLMKTLKDVGVQDILLKTRKEVAINMEKVNCDYYEVLAGNPAGARAFTGEYMSQYSWGEPTLARLCEKLENKNENSESPPK